MRHIITTSVSILVLLLLLNVLRVPDMLIHFLLVGEIPGTRMSLPPNVMLVLLLLAMSIIIAEVTRRQWGTLRRLYHTTTRRIGSNH